MIKIFETVHKLSSRELKDKTEDYKLGFLKCLDYFRMGIKSSDSYNLAIKVREQEKQIQDQLEKIRKLERKLENVSKSERETTLISPIPSKDFHTYNVLTHTGKTFSIVTNMEKDVFYGCLCNFSIRNDYFTHDEAKSKLLTFINSKTFSGFRAFKDFKSLQAYKKKG